MTIPFSSDMTFSSLDSLHKIHVSMGQLFVNSNPSTIFETFVGSCVAICLYDSKKHIGAMAHVMLPTCHVKKIDFTKQGKYADIAINCMLSRMKQKGSNSRRSSNVQT